MGTYFKKSDNSPFLISGPCSAETEEQVNETIDQIVKYNPRTDLLRAGIWKPRTRPDSFEGVGSEGLKWIKQAGERHGLPVTVEVASAKHVEAALNSDIDVLWIGARTTVSPFNVQEIADSLRGVDIPVMIKNPINPDLALWMGAIERLEKQGINEIAAIHRGFSTYQRGIYRNPPIWEIPIELRRRRPELPIIVDPSHIAGKRELLDEVAQQAMDLKFDGLMIESHRDPSKAWSDSAQQLTPEALSSLINNLELRREEIVEDTGHPELHNLRENIDRIDNYILELLSERMKTASDIGRYKMDNNIAIHQPHRWADTVKRALKSGANNGLTEEFILELYKKIHNESIHHQTKIMHPEQDAGHKDNQ